MRKTSLRSFVAAATIDQAGMAVLTPTSKSRAMISTLHHSLRRLVCFLQLGPRRRFSPRDGHQSIHVELLEQRQLLTAGDLDPTFGVGGHVETEYATSTEASKALASVVQSDGKIIAAGEGGIARFLPNGSLDSTFGVGGRVQYPYFALSIALHANGSIVVAGGTASVNSTDFVVSRYLNNGTLDSSFDTDGHAQVSFGGSNEYATDIAIQANGRLVAVGVSDSQIAITRLTATGALDTTFSGDGLLLKTIYSTRNDASDVVIQPDGRIVVGGSAWSYSFSASIHDLYVMRLNPGGGMDATFDTDGVATIVGGRQAVGRDLTLLSNGQIVVSGWSDASFQSNVVVGKFNADGSRDLTFGYEGRTSAQLSSSTSDRTGGEAHVVLADGSIVVSAGTQLIKFGANGVQDISASKFVIATAIHDMISLPGDRLLLAGSVSTRFGATMLKTDRTLDSSWSADGLAPVEFGNSDDIVGRSVQQSNGRIVVASTSLNTFAVTRYLPTGALDTTFSQDGKVSIDFGAQYLNAVAADVAIQADGRIVVVGYVSQVDSINQSSVQNHIAVARLNANGTLDTTFGTNGTVVTYLGGYGRATTVRIQSNGRIVVGGLGNGGYYTLVRYLANGVLDRTFSGDGIQTIVNSNVSSSMVNDLAIQPDGKILAAGDLAPNISGAYFSSMLVMRFNANGSVDTTFGSNGRVISGTMQQRTAQRLVLLSDGSFYVGGNEVRYSSFSVQSQMALSHFTSSGQLVFQKVITPFVEKYAPNPTALTNVNSTLNSILVQPDGRVVMSGSAGNLLGIVRLNADGTDDTSFGGDGRNQLTLPATGRYFGGDVVRQWNGRLVMVGSFRPNGSSRSDLLLTRVDSATPAGPSTSVFVAANGQIQISDNWSRGDSLRLQVVGDHLQVQDLTTDSQASFVVTGVAGATGTGTKSILIPLAVIQQTGKPLVLDTGAGDDRLTAISDPLNFKSLNLQFKAGTGFDELSGLSSAFGTRWLVNGRGAGAVISDFAFGSFTFTDVNSLVGSSSANDQFTLNAISTPEWLMLDGGDGGNDEVRIVANADIKLTNALAEIRGTIQQNVVVQRFENAALFGGAAANLLDGRDFPGRLYLEGGDGDDKLIAGSNNDVLRGGVGNDQLFGNGGDDRLYGDTGDDFLSGGLGNDELYGSHGRDILLAGYGADLLVGGEGQDLLVSGEALGLVDSDFDDLARQIVRSTWSDTQLTYEQRVVALRDTGVGTSAPLLRLTPGQTVFPDAYLDQLFGGGDRDWFFATTVSTGSLDLFADRQTDEELTLLN